MLWLAFWALTSLSVTQSHPLNLLLLRGDVSSASLAGDRTWSLWDLLWAPDALVTVIDRERPVTFPARPALFGADLKSPLLGYVIPLSSFTQPCNSSDIVVSPSSDPVRPLDDPSASPGDDTVNDGCPSLCQSGPHTPGPTEPWIALVQRGNCSFADKARQAQHWGAKAVVVGNYDPETYGISDTLVSMIESGDTSDLNVTATFVKHADYDVLMNLIARSDTLHSGLHTVSLLISSEIPTGGWISPTLTFIGILLLPSLLTFITLLIHRVRTLRAARRERAPEDIVRNLPWRVWTGTGWEKHAGSIPGQLEPSTSPVVEQGEASHSNLSASAESGGLETGNAPEQSNAEVNVEPEWARLQSECVICISEFAVGDRVRVLPCSHLFHMDEIDGWLINNRKLCPICKADVTQPLGAPHPEPEESPAPTERTPLLPQ